MVRRTDSEGSQATEFFYNAENRDQRDSGRKTRAGRDEKCRSRAKWDRMVRMKKNYGIKRKEEFK